MEDREALARAYDPEAFEDHPIEARSHVAAIQWAGRRHLANEAADRLLASGWLTEHERRTLGPYTRTPPDLDVASADYWQGVYDAETGIMAMLGIPIAEPEPANAHPDRSPE
jgi:hypothetical protein